MAADLSLDGGMIPRSTARQIDERREVRHNVLSSTAVLDFRGSRYVVQLVNVSASGAMIIFPQLPRIGEAVLIQLVDRGQLPAKVIWAKGDRAGLSFAERIG